jgi:hypothetical protein
MKNSTQILSPFVMGRLHTLSPFGGGRLHTLSPFGGGRGRKKVFATNQTPPPTPSRGGENGLPPLEGDRIRNDE